MNIQNVLLAMDFSPSSEAALHFARFLAKRYKAKLIVVHVISESMYKDVPAELMQEAKTRTKAEAQAKMERLGAFVQNIQSEFMLEEGPVADTLLSLSESRQIDLLVVGSRGHRRIQRLLLGSVAEKLSRQAACPVLVVPESALSYDLQISLKTILCPTNFSERSTAALKYAEELAKSLSGHILLLHVIESSTVATADRMQHRLVIKERMSRLRSSLSKESSPETDLIVEFGPIAQTITRIAAERDARLVVLSIKKGKPIIAHLPPEITYSVAQQVSCPVLTIAS